MSWRPGHRAAERSLEQPFEDVPDHLFEPLWSWVKEYLSDDQIAFEMTVHFRLPLPDARELSSKHQKVLTEFRNAVLTEPTLLLDIIEVLIDRYSTATSDLEDLLLLGNSIYTVDIRNDRIEVRVLPEVKQQVQAVVDAAAGSPGAHLATAWAEAYGRTPDPVKAYGEAIKAVEAAAAPVIEPNNSKATLGTMLGVLRQDFARWQFAISPGDETVVEEVYRMMGLLWSGQTSRHGGSAPTRAETPEEARVAVHLAATLVQFFVGGSFVKR